MKTHITYQPASSHFIRYKKQQRVRKAEENTQHVATQHVASSPQQTTRVAATYAETHNMRVAGTYAERETHTLSY